MDQKAKKVGLSRATATLSDDEIGLMKGMLKRGDRQIDIALWFGVNQSFVNRLRLGRLVKHKATPPADEKFLPPVGPYVLVARSVADQAQADRLIVQELQSLLAKFTDRLDTYSNPVHGRTARSDTVSTHRSCNTQPHLSGTGS